MSRVRRLTAVTATLAVLVTGGVAGAGGASASGSGAGQGGQTSMLGGLLGGILTNGVALITGQQVAALPKDYSAANDATSLYTLTHDTGARALWARGATGSGVGVALIDSGVAPVAGLSATSGVDLSSTAGTSAAGSDGFGHGTAMAGIIAGHDAGVPTVSGPASFDGFAPDASLVSIKVGEANGWTDPSRVIAGIAWAVQHRRDPGRAPIRVINLSYGTNSRQAYGSDPVAYAAEQAWKAGVVVVASAGNDGTADGHLIDPAIDPYVIAVGASTTGEASSGAAAFSNSGDGVRNADVLAPGVSVQTLRAPGSVLDRLVAANGSRFLKGSGTSEAAAAVSGLVALLLSQQPSLTPDQVKGLLTATASPLAGVPGSVQGHGLVHPATAGIRWPVATATQSFPASLGDGSLDASRGSDSWVAAGATPQQAENPALMGGPTGDAWADRAWAGRSWSGSSWAADGNPGSLAGRSWSGRSWSGRSWSSVGPEGKRDDAD